MHRVLAAASLAAASACGASNGGGDSGAVDSGGQGDGSGGGGGVCPDPGQWTSGRHRLFVQGHQGERRPDGRHPLLHQHPTDGRPILCDDRVFVDDTNGDGRWEPGEEPYALGPDGIVHGEHFLVGAGAFVEIATELCADITGNVAFYIPNFDEAGSVTRHELVVVGESGEQVIAEAIDDEAGQSGYNPFVRVIAGADPVAHAGDLLMLRSTNLSGVAFSVMVWNPPSEYESWILVEVP